MGVSSLSFATTEPDADGQLHALALAIAEGAPAEAEARPLRLVESPTAALARAALATAAAVAPLDATATLQAWCASARRLLREAHQNPGQVVLLDADEVHLAPAAARAAWLRHSGCAASIANGPVAATGPRLDALGLAAAAQVVARHADASRLWGELQGSCLLLQDTSGHDTGTAPDLALKTWREWQLNLADLRQTLGDSRAHLAETQGRLVAQDAELAQARDDASLAEMMRRQSLSELESVSAMAAQADSLARERESRLHTVESRLDDCERSLEQERQARAHEGQQLQQLQTLLAEREARLGVVERELLQRTGALQAALDASSAAIARERAAQAAGTQQIQAELDSLRSDRARFIVLVERSRQEVDQINRQRDSERASMDAERAAFEAERGRLEAIHATLSEQLASLQQQLAAARQEYESLEAQATRQAGDRQREAADLREALAQAARQARADEEALHALEQTGRRLAQREHELQQAIAVLRDDAARQDEHLKQALDQVSTVRTRADALESELSQARQRQQSREAVEAVWRQRLQQAHVRIDLLESQLGDALTGLAQAAVPAAAPSAARSPRWSLPLASTRVALLAERDAAPHRELGLMVDLPAAAQSPAPRFELRLVEHGGRPGLVWLPDARGVPPLHAWQPNGHEGDRPFMRLIPEDADGAALLTRLPSADWRLVVSLCAELPQWLSSLSLTSPDLWHTTAQRLLAQVQAMPPRLRFSDLQTTWSEPDAGGGQPGLAHIRLSDALFGQESLPDIELAFDTTGQRDATLSWLLPASGTPVFASWPVQTDGRLQAHCPLAVGRVLSVPSKWRWWAERPARDRDLILGVLDALPAAADKLGGPAQALPLRQQLADLHREARRLVERQALGKRLRRLMNLLRPTAPA